MKKTPCNKAYVFTKILFFTLITIIIVSCDKSEPLSIVAGTDEYIVKPDGETFAITVTSNVTVDLIIQHVSSSSNWLKESPSNIGNSGVYHFIAEPNDGYDNRDARIIFTNRENNVSDTVNVIQLQKNVIVLTDSICNIKHTGGEIFVKIASNTDFSVKIGAEWIKQSTTRALIWEEIGFSIQLNTSTENREAIITFTSEDNKIIQELKVVQDANYHIPTLDWGQSASQVKKYMEKYTLLYEDNTNLIFENEDPYIMIAYGFINGKLFEASRYTPSILNNAGQVLQDKGYSEIIKTFEDFTKITENPHFGYWSESAKTVLFPFGSYTASGKRYSGYEWFCTEYLD